MLGCVLRMLSLSFKEERKAKEEKNDVSEVYRLI